MIDIKDLNNYFALKAIILFIKILKGIRLK